jgi:staphylococcal nuclease domain-containing protein 1
MYALLGVIVEKPEKSEEKIPIKPYISTFDKQYPLVDKDGQTKGGNVVLHYVRDAIFQRKVDVSVKKMDDKGGVFLGLLFLEGKDFALQLIEKGYARIHRQSLRKFPFFSAYKAAEDKAREAKIGYWEHHNFEQEKKGVEDAAKKRDNQQKRENHPIAVTDVRSGSHFSFQIMDDETASLVELSASLQNEKFSTYPPYTPKLHDIVAAQFTLDDLWYRAQIIGEPQKNSKDQLFEVRYLDYGNREFLGTNRIRELPREYLDLIKPQAKDAKLLYVKAPKLESEFGRDSMTALRDLLWDKVLYAEVAYTEKAGNAKDWKDPPLFYHLIVYEEKNDINQTLISLGHARVEKVPHELAQDPYYQGLEELQEEAFSKRLAMWQYGYYPDSDEEQDDY